MKRLVPTGEMTLGPFFPREFGRDANDLTGYEGRPAKGQVIEITGRVVQLDGKPLDNLVLEIWQPDASGIFRDPVDPRHAQADPDFFGWGRAATDPQGVYCFRTIRPGAYPARAPHINFLILYSGLMRQLQTVMFFQGEALNENDPVLASVEPAAVRARLIAREQLNGSYRFDIRLRGEGETPFFGD